MVSLAPGCGVLRYSGVRGTGSEGGSNEEHPDSNDSDPQGIADDLDDEYGWSIGGDGGDGE